MKSVYKVLSILMATFAFNSQAALITQISGVEGAGVTQIDFSGTATVLAGSNSFESGDGDSGAFFDFGDYVNNINNDDFDILSGSAFVNINGLDISIDSIYLDNDSNGLDDFGFSVVGDEDILVTVDDVISLIGSVTIAVDFSEFNLGAFTSSDFGFGDATLDMNLFVAPAEVSVPAPSLILLFSLFAMTILGLKHRRK